VFGADDVKQQQIQQDATKLTGFNFGSQSIPQSNSFNFTSPAPPKSTTIMTNTSGITTGTISPIGSSQAPFVFASANFSSTGPIGDFQQALTPTSSRLIKKPNRRIKK
jgi:hypothetical protein